MAESLAPDTYFGACRAVDDRALVVAFSEQLSPTAHEQLKESARPLRLDVRVVTNSAARLREVMDRITEDVAEWQRRGVSISGFGFDWESNKVEVGIVEAEAALAEVVEMHYGRDVVYVLSDAPHAVPAS